MTTQTALQLDVIATCVAFLLLVGVVLIELRRLMKEIEYVKREVDVILSCLSSYDEEDAQNDAELNKTTLEVMKMLREQYSSKNNK